jgi:hypothetical protein
MSFCVSEKKATSLPEIRKEMSNNKMAINISTPVTTGTMVSN